MATRTALRASPAWIAIVVVAPLAGCHSGGSVSGEAQKPPGDVPTTGPTDTTFVPPAPTTRWIADMSNGACHAQLQTSSAAAAPYPCPSAFPTAGAYSFTIERAPGATSCVARYAKPGTGGQCPPNVPCIVNAPQYVTVDVPCPGP